MRTRLVRRLLAMGFLMLAGAAEAQTSGQTIASRLVVDVGIGVDPSINGNVNSGAIGRCRGWRRRSFRSLTATYTGPASACISAAVIC